MSSFDTSEVTNMFCAFYGCTNFTTLDLSNFNTSNVISNGMMQMFQNCSKLTSLDLSSFVTSKMVNMSSMFNNCSNLTTIKGTIDMKSCKYCYNMFYNCPKLTGVKIRNPPSDFESKSGLSSSQYTIVS